MTEIPLAERRAQIRRRVFKGGTITFDGAGVDCTVRNISNSGAALDLTGLAAIPPAFRLAIAADGFITRARVVWNRGRRFGVAFDQACLDPNSK